MSLEVKKPSPNSGVAGQTTNPFGWLKGLREEFGKISWTTREELRAYTKIVAVATLAVGLGIYLMDLAVQGLLGGLNVIVRWIIGG
jgi:preprotein translocase subunit SecE